MIARLRSFVSDAWKPCLIAVGLVFLMLWPAEFAPVIGAVLIGAVLNA